MKISNLLLVALLTLIVSGCVDKPIDYMTVEPELTIKARRLYVDYSKNEELAGTKYSNKIIQIDGTLSRMEPLGDSSITIIYNFSNDDTEAGIRVNMLPQAKESAIKISKKQTVHIKGVCTGYDGTNVLIEKGSLAK